MPYITNKELDAIKEVLEYYAEPGDDLVRDELGFGEKAAELLAVLSTAEDEPNPDLVRVCLAAWNNVPVEHPTVSKFPIDEGSRKAYGRIIAAITAAVAPPYASLPADEASALMTEVARHHTQAIHREVGGLAVDAFERVEELVREAIEEYIGEKRQQPRPIGEVIDGLVADGSLPASVAAALKSS